MYKNKYSALPGGLGERIIGKWGDVWNSVILEVFFKIPTKYNPHEEMYSFSLDNLASPFLNVVLSIY